MKSFKQFFEVTGDDERAAERNYTGHGFLDMNTRHWKAKYPNPRRFKGPVDKKLSQAIKQQTSSKTMVVHRLGRIGTDAHHQMVRDKVAKKGSTTVRHRGYMSTTSERHLPEVWHKVFYKPKGFENAKGHFWHIKVPAGAHHVDMNQHNVSSWADDEKEVLFHKGVKLHVHRVVADGNNFHYHATMVHDGIKKLK